MTGAVSLRMGSSKRASIPGTSCARPRARRQRWWSIVSLPRLLMGLCTAFRLWQAQVATTPTSSTEALPSLSSALLGAEGTARCRHPLRTANPDKLILFIGQAYGIFHLAEFAILTHLPLRQLPAALGSPQAILQRFGLSP